MKKSQDHTQLTRLAAISLVLMLCLSVVPFMAPSAAATVIDVEADVEDALLDYQTPSIPYYYTISDKGVMYGAITPGYTFGVSYDLGQTWSPLHVFGSPIKTPYAYSHGGDDYVFVSLENGEIYRRVNDGPFTLVHQMNVNKWAAMWSWASSPSHDRLLIGEYGEYGDTNSTSAVYISYDNGDTWDVLFDTTSLGGAGADHIHLVSVDPYHPDTYYVATGDDPRIYGLYVTQDGGATWTRVTHNRNVYRSGSHGIGNGFLACTYPDEDRVFFFADNYPQIWEYIKSTGDLRLLAQFPGDYTTHDVKTYSAVLGQHGLTYFAMTEYLQEVELSHVWITLDGSDFYRLNGDELDTMRGNSPLHAYDGRIYGRDISFRDLTLEEYGMLVGGKQAVDVWSSAQYLNIIDRPLKDITLTVTGKTVRNLVGNPSFEAGTEGWTTNNAILDRVEDDSCDGDYVATVSFTNGTLAEMWYTISGEVLTGAPIIVRMTMQTDAPITRDVQLKILYEQNGETKTWTSYAGDDFHTYGNALTSGYASFTFYWMNPPAGSTLKRFSMSFYDPDVTYFIDRVSVSESPIYVNEETPSGDVSFMLGDHLIEAGELADGESKTISLPSDVWLDGVVPIVPVTGLAYTVSIDGTPVSKSEQSVRETSRLLEQTLPLIIGLAVISGLITMVGRIKF